MTTVNYLSHFKRKKNKRLFNLAAGRVLDDVKQCCTYARDKHIILPEQIFTHFDKTTEK